MGGDCLTITSRLNNKNRGEDFKSKTWMAGKQCAKSPHHVYVTIKIWSMYPEMSPVVTTNG
jgi:hypothetical protein